MSDQHAHVEVEGRDGRTAQAGGPDPDGPAGQPPADRDADLRPARAPRWWLALTAAIVLILIVTRVAGLDVSLWWDEAFTAQRYVRGGRATFLDPELYFANNHLLFTVLAWATARVLSSTAEWVLRLWAFIPAMAACALLVRWQWIRHGPLVGTLTLTLATTSTLWLATTIQARGYGLVLAAATLMLLVPVSAGRRPTWAADLLVAGAGTAAMLTFPPAVAVYLAHTGLWLAHRTARIRLVVLTAAAGVVTLLVYRPLLSLLFERADQVGSRWSEPITWWSPVLAPLQLLGGPSLSVEAGTAATEAQVAMGSPAALLALALGLIGLLVAVRRDQWLAWHLLAGLGGAVLLLWPVGFHLADRYLTFLLPHVTIVVALGLVALVHLAMDVDDPGVPELRPAGLLWRPVDGAASDEVRPIGGAGGPAARVAVAALAVGLLALNLPALWWASTTPLQAFRPAAELALAARADDPDTIIVVDRYHTGYRWYLDHVEVTRITDQDELDALLCEPPAPVIFARHPDDPRLEVPGCLDERHERRFEHQRPPGYLSLWVVAPG